MRRMGSGFLVLIPLLVTLGILRIVIVTIDDLVRPLKFVRDSPYDFVGIGLIVGIVLLYVVGVLVSSGAGRRVVDWQGAVLSRIPIIKTIYGVAKQTTDALTSPMAHRFSRVVFLEYPRPGVMAMGFVTGHSTSPGGEGHLLVVYIPTVPNPTSGMLAFVPEDDIIESEITVEQAMKMVFSGGIVLPDMMQVGYGASLYEPPQT